MQATVEVQQKFQCVLILLHRRIISSHDKER
jgi:hypothetical protein